MIYNSCMVYYYKLGYHDWEESPHITLVHNKQFTKSEFDEMVLQSYVVADEKLKLANKTWLDEWVDEKVNNGENLDDDYIDDMKYRPSVGDLYQEVINHMISEYNFFEPKIEQSFIPSNCYDLLNPEKLDKNDEVLMAIHHRLKVVEMRDKKLNKVLNKKTQS